jgi:HEAT repeat protein
VVGLATRGGSPVVASLVRAAHNAPEPQRLQALRLFRALGDRGLQGLTSALEDPSPQVAAEATEALSALGTQAAPALSAALQGGGEGTRRAAARALGRIRGAAVVDALARALADPDAEVRRSAARALGDHKDPASLDALLPLLRDLSAGVAEEAAKAVGRIGDPRAVDPLIEAARGQAGAGVNLAILEALAALGGPQTLAFLLQRLDHPDPRHVSAAAAALGAFQDPQAVDALIGKLEHGHEGVRVAAARSLARIGHPLAVTALTLALERAARRDAEKRELEAALRKLSTTR